MTIDGFYLQEEAERLCTVISNLQFVKTEFGQEVANFNMVADDADELFSRVLNKQVEVIKEHSGIFRQPELFIHFEGFDAPNEWIFAVALGHPYTTFNIFEHQSGPKNALEGYKHNYKNLFEWDLTVNYQLQPGQGIFFRPWLFHSFDHGLIQVFRLREK